MNAIYRNIIRPLAVGVMGMALALSGGCSMIYDPDVEKPEENTEEKVCFSFKVTSFLNPVGLGETRADGNGHDETESYLPSVEDMVNIQDFAMFIFAGDDDNAKLLFTNLSESPDITIAGSPGSYDVHITVDKETMENYFGGPLGPTGNRTVRFRIMALANSKADIFAVNGNYGTIPVTIGTTTLNEVITAAKGIVYKLDNSFYEKTAISSTSTRIRGLIPMFGLNTTPPILESVLYESRPELPVSLGEVSLLRAVPKVRVADNIQNKNEEGYPKITEVSFSYGYPQGYVLPKDAETYVDGSQVHDLNIPAQTPTETVIDMIASNEPVDNVNRDVWFGYCPEQTIVTSGLPTFHITAQLNADETKTFDVPLSGYKDQVFTWTGSEGKLLRNHIYTLSVDRIDFAATLELTATVEDWDEASFTLDYSETVSTSDGGQIDWIAGTFASETVDGTGNGTLIVSPWHNVTGPDGTTSMQPVVASCTFGLSSPMGALWTASLLHEEGAPSAFWFMDADGKQVDQIQGRIDGRRSTLQIVPAIESPTQNSRARLQIVVSLAGGNKFVDATVPTILGNWTIVQTQQ